MTRIIEINAMEPADLKAKLIPVLEAAKRDLGNDPHLSDVIILYTMSRGYEAGIRIEHNAEGEFSIRHAARYGIIKAAKEAVDTVFPKTHFQDYAKLLVPQKVKASLSPYTIQAPIEPLDVVAILNADSEWERKAVPTQVVPSEELPAVEGLKEFGLFANRSSKHPSSKLEEESTHQPTTEASHKR